MDRNHEEARSEAAQASEATEAKTAIINNIVDDGMTIELSEEQNIAMSIFRKGGNLFLTGPGGSGKTELIKKMMLIAQLRKKNVQVCALTGCAAILLKTNGGIGAKTIHSWAGVGLCKDTVYNVVDRVVKNKYKTATWKKTDILIVDEVSMMSKKLFTILDKIGRVTRKRDDLPFGGIQVIFSGDFYQLPPVGDADDTDTSAFCFESETWNNTFGPECIVQLKTIFRQTDKEYSDILNQIRVGKLKKSAYDKLMTRVNNTSSLAKDGIKPTIMMPKRRDVDLINSTEMSKLELNGNQKEEFTMTVVQDDASSSSSPSSARAFYAKAKSKKYAGAQVIEYVSEQTKEFEIKFLKENVMVGEKIILTIGTQVMCVANIGMDSSHPIANGSQGVVTRFSQEEGRRPVVRFSNGKERVIDYHTWYSENVKSIGVKQLPLIYSWAITIHKSQGVSLDFAEIDAGSNIFECGQTYVALSRVKTLEGLFLTSFNPQKIMVNKKVKGFYDGDTP
jgi:ATP-dependent DNA helicase PIF1